MQVDPIEIARYQLVCLSDELATFELSNFQNLLIGKGNMFERTKSIKTFGKINIVKIGTIIDYKFEDRTRELAVKIN